MSRNKLKHRLLQGVSLLVSTIILILFGNLILESNPSDTIVGRVVTAIEELKENQQQKSLSILVVTISLTVALVLVYLYLRKYDTPLYSQ